MESLPYFLICFLHKNVMFDGICILLRSNQSELLQWVIPIKAHLVEQRPDNALLTTVYEKLKLIWYISLFREGTVACDSRQVDHT